MAEIYSFLITDKLTIEKKATKDRILYNKIKYIESGIDKIVKLND